jgi:hypothetical protein
MLRFPHGSECVRHLAGLGDGDYEIAVIKDGIAVAELCGLLHFRIDIGKVFEGVCTDHRRVQRGAAAAHHDARVPPSHNHGI